jgi:3-oxoacyl-(acyl-carrier-protein) synthase
MNLRIAGMGWVTPLGRGVDTVWDGLLKSNEAAAQETSDSVSDKKYFAYRIPNDALRDLPPHPRLRRASAISRFAAAAGLDALADARSTIGQIDPKRMALVLAVSNGGVVYTKRFYQDIVESGAQSASPLFFPETVFNAPASHVAAILGMTGASYTIVGDGAVGVLAIKMASDLMENKSLDACLVIGAEEADWILCDAYHKWRLIKKDPPIELFRDPPRGTILSEGGGAIVIARDGEITIDAISAGGNFSRRQDADATVQKILRELAGEQAFVIGSANGTFVDLAEGAAIKSQLPDSTVYSLKPALGESVGASALWQVIAGAQALRTKRLPPVLHSTPKDDLRIASGGETSGSKAIISACGLNQQAAGLRLSI